MSCGCIRQEVSTFGNTCILFINIEELEYDELMPLLDQQSIVLSFAFVAVLDALPPCLDMQCKTGLQPLDIMCASPNAHPKMKRHAPCQRKPRVPGPHSIYNMSEMPSTPYIPTDVGKALSKRLGPRKTRCSRQRRVHPLLSQSLRLDHRMRSLRSSAIPNHL